MIAFGALSAGALLGALGMTVILRSGRRIPPAGELLAVAGMIGYPICATGLAATIGTAVSPAAGWLVALVLCALVAVPRLLHGLDQRATDRDRAAYARAHPVDPYRGAPTVPGPPASGL